MLRPASSISAWSRTRTRAELLLRARVLRKRKQEIWKEELLKLFSIPETNIS